MGFRTGIAFDENTFLEEWKSGKITEWEINSGDFLNNSEKLNCLQKKIPSVIEQIVLLCECQNKSLTETFKHCLLKVKFLRQKSKSTQKLNFGAQDGKIERRGNNFVFKVPDLKERGMFVPFTNEGIPMTAISYRRPQEQTLVCNVYLNEKFEVNQSDECFAKNQDSYQKLIEFAKSIWPNRCKEMQMSKEIS
eukprot:GHVP01024029.1.p2 GENE.GHVP01024029.1~~GHVP01024029.1.p2  ORF type:complete len:193 (-),score=34.76 GHVP01024029.1:599-1177(-)